MLMEYMVEASLVEVAYGPDMLVESCSQQNQYSA
jgi:hypothetical protein